MKYYKCVPQFFLTFYFITPYSTSTTIIIIIIYLT